MLYSTLEHLRVLVYLNIQHSKSVCHGRIFVNESDILQSLQENSKAAIRNNNAYKTSENKASEVDRLE